MKSPIFRDPSVKKYARPSVFLKFYRLVCKKIRASVKTSVKMSNATLKRLGSRRPRSKTPIFTMKNEHFFTDFLRASVKSVFATPLY